LRQGFRQYRAKTHRVAGDIDDILLDAIEFGNQRIGLRTIDRMTINPLRWSLTLRLPRAPR
jgi:hypothetical protein